MSLIDGLLSTMSYEGVKAMSIAGICVHACAYVAIAQNYLKYVSDFFLYREQQNILYAIPGAWIQWKVGEWSVVQVAAQIFALISYSARCTHQSVRISEEMDKLYWAILGYEVLPRGGNNEERWNVYWISPSLEDKLRIIEDYSKRYIFNLAWRCAVLAKEVLELIAFTNDLIATAMWIPGTRETNVIRCFINLDYLIGEGAVNLPTCIKLFENKRDSLQRWLDWFRAPKPMDAENFIRCLNHASTAVAAANFVLEPIRGNTLDALIQGVNVAWLSLGGWDLDLTSPDSSTKLSPSSPFRLPTPSE